MGDRRGGLRSRAAAVLLCLSFSSPATAAEQPQAVVLHLAVVPQVPAVESYRDWGPLLDRLSRQLGVAFVLTSYASIHDFESALVDGAPDLAYMNPYHAVMVHKRPGYIPLVRDDSRPLRGILVVRRDSAIRTPLELAGQTVAFASPNAFSSALYMRALLLSEFGLGIQPH
ncbi:MAG: PhnD/SsuA/transferrin family substrate-binding protein, partial [Myxococcota bacterium]